MQSLLPEGGTKKQVFRAGNLWLSVLKKPNFGFAETAPKFPRGRYGKAASVTAPPWQHHYKKYYIRHFIHCQFIFTKNKRLLQFTIAAAFFIQIYIALSPPSFYPLSTQF